MEAFEIARINMVKSQIMPADITSEALLDIVREVPRQIFIPEDRQGVAYIDAALPVGGGRYILPPMVFAKMVAALEIKHDEAALDIACGTGYSSVILASLCKRVVAVESNTDLASKAHQNLNKLGVSNVIIISNLLAQGHLEGAPYDAILINGAIREVPQNLFDQLGEGGRLVTIISKTPHSGSIVLYKKTAGNLTCNEILDINLPVIEDF